MEDINEVLKEDLDTGIYTLNTAPIGDPQCFLDDAVELVGSLDEPEELNFLAARVRAEVEEKVAAGVKPTHARRGGRVKFQ